jgi:uncharacterized protein (UPF0332 family)
MPFNWNDFLTLAAELAPKPDEASKRTAISRAYYCVFNLANARAELKVGRRPKGEPSHQWCWDQYRNTHDLTCSHLGNAGERLKRMRVKADYEAADNRRLREEVERVLEDAREFLDGLAALNPNYPSP